MFKKRWGIINGGGDAPGMNTVIASIVKYAERNGFELLGFLKGWDGLLDKEFIILDQLRVRGISHLGGTFLKTVNKGRFSAKVGNGNTVAIEQSILDNAVKNATDLGIEGFFVIGGDGTQAGSIQLLEKGYKIIAIPKTIDNDLPFVSRTFGFSTAIEIASESMQRLQTTATSHDRVFLVELMGRNTGWITLFAGLGGGADAILLPEFDFDLGKFVNHLYERKKSGRSFSIVAISEGLKIDGELTGDERVGGEYKLHGISTKLVHLLNEKYSDDFEFRNHILGHLQRGGAPNSEDMILAKSYGIAAVDAALENDSGKMVVLHNERIERIELKSIFGKTKYVTKEIPELEVAIKLGIFVNI